ncbi:MAG: HTTM domain-containing protein [Myxococcales bacterium]|nr:HTTM domain-containing protein [Myxococcales bacterium]
MWNRFCAHLEEPVDIALAAVWRVLFGLLLFVSVLRFFLYDWIYQLYQQPRLFFPYEGFEWVRPWPGSWMTIHFVLMGLFALGIALGAWYRLSVFGFWLLFTYVELIDKTTYLNHYYFVSLVCFLMLFIPLQRSLSVDAWRDPSLRSEHFPRWCLWLLRFQVGVVYFFAGVAKLKIDWLFYGQPLRIWLASHTDLPILGPWFVQPWVPMAMSWAGALFDLTIVAWLLWSRTRWLAYAAVLAFHLLTWKLFFIGIFPWVMILNATLFFPPDTPRLWWKAWKAWWGKASPQTPLKEASVKSAKDADNAEESSSTELASQADVVPSSKEGAASASIPSDGTVTWSWRRRLAYAVVGLYIVLQVFLPLRHWFYPGEVCWTEQGFRFSWKVMLMEKNGTVDFWVSHPPTKRRWLVTPRAYLTALQFKMMSTQPDMILYFAHWLAKDFARRGIGPVEVRVNAFASLNGRPMQRLIDPKVDLVKEPWITLRARPWIEPFRRATRP